VRIVIVGGGLVGLALWRILERRALDASVLERSPAGTFAPRPFMLPYQGFDALEAAGVLDPVRAASRDIAPGEGEPVALATDFVGACRVLAEGIPVAHERTVVGLERMGPRVVGLRAAGPAGEEAVAADLVVACDGVRSPVREMAGIEAELSRAEGGHLSFMSPVVIDRAFAMAYQSDGRQVGLLGWPEGSAGWWDIDRVGREAALAPGLEAFRRAFARLLPPAAPALEGLTSMEQVVYREVTEVRCPEWWVPGVVVIGDAAHFLGPEAGIGAGMGLGDALALAEAIAQHPDDPDAACREYEHWRRPATRPYEIIGAAGARMTAGPPPSERPEAERWPPTAAAT
jgi:2-polyprenyl-6-methoxyphenol hydroxylase-like FAD-dependent oxidoreductase